MPCCDICDHTLLDRTRPGVKKSSAGRRVAYEKEKCGVLEDTIDEWRETVLERDVPEPFFTPSYILPDEAVAKLSTLQLPLSRLNISNLLAPQWIWWPKYGEDLMDMMLAVIIPEVAAQVDLEMTDASEGPASQDAALSEDVGVDASAQAAVKATTTTRSVTEPAPQKRPAQAPLIQSSTKRRRVEQSPLDTAVSNHSLAVASSSSSGQPRARTPIPAASPSQQAIHPPLVQYTGNTHAHSGSSSTRAYGLPHDYYIAAPPSLHTSTHSTAYPAISYSHGSTHAYPNAPYHPHPYALPHPSTHPHPHGYPHPPTPSNPHLPPHESQPHPNHSQPYMTHLVPPTHPPSSNSHLYPYPYPYPYSYPYPHPHPPLSTYPPANYVPLHAHLLPPNQPPVMDSLCPQPSPSVHPPST